MKLLTDGGSIPFVHIWISKAKEHPASQYPLD